MYVMLAKCISFDHLGRNDWPTGKQSMTFSNVKIDAIFIDFHIRLFDQLDHDNQLQTPSPFGASDKIWIEESVEENSTTNFSFCCCQCDSSQRTTQMNLYPFCGKRMAHLGTLVKRKQNEQKHANINRTPVEMKRTKNTPQTKRQKNENKNKHAQTIEPRAHTYRIESVMKNMDFHTCQYSKLVIATEYTILKLLCCVCVCRVCLFVRASIEYYDEQTTNDWH